MENCFGQFGWKEFHRNRKNILCEYEKLIEQTENRPVRVAHGPGVEAYIRRWLAEFLPKKFGVTSGYIIPDLYGEGERLYHFDVIIYDALNSPVLWVEGNEDNSSQGRYRAIPASHVVSVYEVKSRLTKKSAREAIDKLDQMKGFSDQLHGCYSCGVIFIELKESETNATSVMQSLMNGKHVHGFTGGLVLRYEMDDSVTGVLRTLVVKDEQASVGRHRVPLAKPINDLNVYANEDGSLTIDEQGAGIRLVKTGEDQWSPTITYGTFCDDGDWSLNLSWSRSGFADFCVDLIGRLEGLSFSSDRRPSFGLIFDSIPTRKAPAQSKVPEAGKPFVSVGLHSGGVDGNMHEISESPAGMVIKFWVGFENKSDSDVVLSDDGFKVECKLKSGQAAIRPVEFAVVDKGDHGAVWELLHSSGMGIEYRAVYFSGEEKKEFYSIDITVMVKADDVSILEK